jgi:hypothetical protein
MKWHDDLSKWQERLSQAGGLLSVGAGFVLRSAFEAEQPRPQDSGSSTTDAAGTSPATDPDR